ncbi:hypothetical protein CAOG_08597 [Capsaspora owczarzaki ATCC 30864]|uniref:C2 domain-containing protein n=1 Tax=Capsaspora owczarzaki (strain ATCC 30864) TaxID=595528 RepID=A0A0D2WL51_CAPO3|nr:hypothetical protein CAOG_08597 [Capsaspora owczarzaki ATCC 30864]KJE91210.1 hypothetical protein CAOG_008597 [Capsaspora owczarzaki ATCC 30864]|eukprot:XP_011270197.1 hypothetical protein CAOG_08597 [Capsaspora owczarzaki ATCC 30864]
MSNLVSKIELRFSAKDLISMDTLSKTDPLVVVSLATGHEAMIEVGQTERVKNNQSPQFVTPVPIDYSFEVVQQIKFTLYDSDGPGKREYIGEVSTTVAEVVSKGAAKWTSVLYGKDGKPHKGLGSITVSAEEVRESRIAHEFWFKANKLDKKDLFGKSDPYFRIMRMGADGQFTPVVTSPVIKNTLDPTWAPVQASARQICNGDLDRPLRIEVFDWDRDGGHDLIGVTEQLSLRQLIDPNYRREFPLVNEKKKAKHSKYTNSGTFTVYKVVELPAEYSFLDYLHGGLEINFTVAIDFTGSNGDPKHPTSLHYMTPFQQNQYQQALWQVGNVIAPYDADRLFPAFGFGGKLKDGSISHDFALNGIPTNPYCVGIEGIMQAYTQAITNVELWGPTNFAPIIKQVAGFATAAEAKMATEPRYFVLLILTDGVITDMDATCQAIIQASSLPMSIIIVGVGSADFAQMNILDADVQPLKHAGRVATRDIVQFVSFEDYKNKPPGILARDVLAEVPQQLLQYMRAKKLQPKKLPPSQ